MKTFVNLLVSQSRDNHAKVRDLAQANSSLVGQSLLALSHDRRTLAKCRRFRVRPGLSGLAWVRLCNHLSWKERFAQPVERVDQRRRWLHLIAAMLAVGAVIRLGDSHADLALLTAKESVA